MDTLDVLKKGRELISGPGSWVQTWWERGETPDGKVKDSYCALGAVKVAAKAASPYGRDWNDDSSAAALALGAVIGRPDSVNGPMNFNDKRDQKQECVLAMFDAAIELEELREHA